MGRAQAALPHAVFAPPIERQDLSGREATVYRISTPAELLRTARDLSRSARIALDTESNSMHAYREQVCWLQIRTAEGIHLVDTVAIRDLSALRQEIAAGPAIKLLHGADYDVVCMKRDFGFGPAPIFDTMIAAQMLGFEQLGYGALVQRYCDVSLDKAHQRHDWGARPLDPAVLPYLVDDVRYLPEIHDALLEELLEQDLMEEVELEFRRVEQLAWTGASKDDPDAWSRVKGARDLDRRGRAILRSLFALREGLAASANRPVFKVLGNQQLLALCESPPHDLQELMSAGLLPSSLARRYGRPILEAIQAGLANEGDIPRDLPRRRAADAAREGIDQDLEEALKEWRRRESLRAKLTPLALLPNHVITDLATRRPRTALELGDRHGLQTARRQSYVDALYAVVRSVR